MEKMLKILVTGATGYIGSHLCKVLYEAGHTITALDIEWKKHNHIMPYVHRILVKDVSRLVIDEDYDVIVHLAGYISVEESVRRPSLYYGCNIGGTSNLLNHQGNPHFIFASTAGAFDPQSPYARSKVAAEDIIKEKSNNYTIFRFFNVAGSNGIHRQIGKASHLIRIAAETAVNKRDRMYIYGEDYETPDGTCIRDYIHVVDLVNTIKKTIDHGAFNTPYECIGSGKGYSVKEVVAAMKEVTCIDFKVEVSDRRAGDPPSLAIDNQFKLLEPTLTLKDMCLSAYQAEKTRV
jgi:UDP-glucose 4-epimerase